MLKACSGRNSARIFLAVLALGLTGCNPAPQPAKLSSELVERGRAVYNYRCYFCHGYSGNAKTLAATFLTPPPADFLSATSESMTLSRIETAVQAGRAGTAMKSFQGVISDRDIAAVSAFVFDEFVVRKASNTRYHTPENGWFDHDRYKKAFPFATGLIALDKDPALLSAEEQSGRRLYLEACVTCHDRGKATADSVVWESRPLSYPRNNYDHRKPEVDAATSATPFRLHDEKPSLPAKASASARRGEKLYQENCAFCHAADGTGKNWIGSFLEPHPRNLTDHDFMSSMTQELLRERIKSGIKNSSMPAWKDVLSVRQIDDIINYIDAVFHPVADNSPRAINGAQ